MWKIIISIIGTGQVRILMFSYLAGPLQWGHVCLHNILYLSRQGSYACLNA